MASGHDIIRLMTQVSSAVQPQPTFLQAPAPATAHTFLSSDACLDTRRRCQSPASTCCLGKRNYRKTALASSETRLLLRLQDCFFFYFFLSTEHADRSALPGLRATSFARQSGTCSSITGVVLMYITGMSAAIIRLAACTTPFARRIP